MKNRTCCFTGHRKLSYEKLGRIALRLREEITSLIRQGVIYFGTGGALGFDTLAALTVLELREKYPQIRLILVLPCKELTIGWTEKNKQIYKAIRDRADKTVYTSERYYRGCMQKRNRHLVHHSKYCICYLDKLSGGTFYAVQYAKKHGLTIINLA